MSEQRSDVTFIHESMLYPVTDAAQDTDDYREFAEEPFLTTQGMA
ncbi:hypothetical protein [Streptomyces humi]